MSFQCYFSYFLVFCLLINFLSSLRSVGNLMGHQIRSWMYEKLYYYRFLGIYYLFILFLSFFFLSLEGHGFESWKQPLCISKGKAAYIRLTSPSPFKAGSLVHQRHPSSSWKTLMIFMFNLTCFKNLTGPSCYLLSLCFRTCLLLPSLLKRILIFFLFWWKRLRGEFHTSIFLHSILDL